MKKTSLHHLREKPLDVIIIGGGPAGAALGSYLGKNQISSLILEKEKFPRHHVGESLVPASNRVFNEIGFMETMEQAGFLKKYGATWTADGNRYYGHGWQDIENDCKADVEFAELEENDAYTFHVDRSQFDYLLLQHAEKCGAFVLQETKVTQVNFNNNGLHQVEFKLNNESHTASAPLIVDASGRNTFLGNRLNIKVKDPHFDQFAIHSWFKNFDRGTDATAEHIQIHFLPVPNSWIWQIPITEDITSIGVVSQSKNFKEQNLNHEGFFYKCLKSYPALEAKIAQSERVHPIRVEGDYSYAMKSITGDGWALVGDAARFVDPIFSSGVSVALNSSRFLAQSILKHRKELKSCSYRKEFLNDYAATLKSGTETWYEFITLYYKLNVLFTRFVNDPKHRKDVLKLLSGDVYGSEKPEILSVMQKMVDEIESNPKHFLNGKLGQLTAHSFRETAAEMN